MNIKKFFVSAAIMISFAFAQAGSISGVVVDSNGSFPLGGANVFLEGTDKGGITDNEGKVYILDVPVGDYTVIVSYIGFDSFEQSVRVQENSTINFLASLSAGVIEGSDVNVLGNSLSSQARALNSQKNKVNVSNIVSADQIGKFPDSNIGDALKRVPGIVVYNDLFQTTPFTTIWTPTLIFECNPIAIGTFILEYWHRTTINFSTTNNGCNKKPQEFSTTSPNL